MTGGNLLVGHDDDHDDDDHDEDDHDDDHDYDNDNNKKTKYFTKPSRWQQPAACPSSAETPDDIQIYFKCFFLLQNMKLENKCFAGNLYLVHLTGKLYGSKGSTGGHFCRN